MITIDFLKHYPHCISSLANIWHEVLGKIWIPDVPIVQVEENLHTHLNNDVLPITFVARKENTPVGMCSLRDNDGIRPDLTPWLGSLVVSTQHQNQGIARMLIERVKQQAYDLGFKTVYLFALDPTIPDYYGRLGWEVIAHDQFKGHPVTVMKIILAE